MWFGMIILLGLSCLYAIRYLASAKKQHDRLSVAFASTGIWMGMLGIFTGMLWANFTWGAPWSGDPKQNAAAIGLMIYFAYMILRNALQDPQQKARISAVYNIFAFAALIPILFVLPRLTDSLHPGNGGNPGFNAYDLDSKLRLVFYPAVIGWTLLGVWLTHLKLRFHNIEDKLLNINDIN